MHETEFFQKSKSSEELLEVPRRNVHRQALRGRHSLEKRCTRRCAMNLTFLSHETDTLSRAQRPSRGIKTEQLHQFTLKALYIAFML